MTRIALNGLGRIGKLALRDLIDTGIGGEIVLINDPVGDAEQHAILIHFGILQAINVARSSGLSAFLIAAIHSGVAPSLPR